MGTCETAVLVNSFLGHFVGRAKLFFSGFQAPWHLKMPVGVNTQSHPTLIWAANGLVPARPQAHQVLTLICRDRLAQNRALAFWNQANLGLKSGFVTYYLSNLENFLNLLKLQFSHLKIFLSLQRCED